VLLPLQVYGLYVGLLLGALNRLPIRLPQKGPGRKHKAPESSSPVMFDDVAGVDEAKEELQEIVVSGLGGCGGGQGRTRQGPCVTSTACSRVA
jgi:hypothetical protein